MQANHFGPMLTRPRLTRRSALLGLTAAFTLGRTSLALAATATDQRFVVVLLRGAMDGLSAVQPYGDPAFAGIRGGLALGAPGQPGGVLDLGGFYGLHPGLSHLHAMYTSGEALILHATAGHYRSRSHFEAQDCLESGADQRLESGWLNRAVSLMPSRPGADTALSVGLSAPLLLRGPATVQAWAPDHFQQPDADLYARLVHLNAHDPVIGPALKEGVERRNGANALLGASDSNGQNDHSLAMMASAAGKLLAQANGPRVAVLDFGGWDTHIIQARRLQAQFTQLDAGFAALKDGLGPAWSNTVVLAVTEFGRTAHINGTQGTDHGTGGAAFLLGGAVAGGKVRATWPGLGAGQLFENRDLAPTMDMRSIIKGVLVDHLALPGAHLSTVLPGSEQAAPLSGLVRA
jgi:uncharacterized protein (DUF1501 family)